MNNRAFFKLSRDRRFIPGISEYCDRWCERCSLSSRCLDFAARAAREVEKLQGGQADTLVALDGDEEKQWLEFEQNARGMMEMMERAAQEGGMNLSEFTSKLFEDSGDRINRQADKHTLSRKAGCYSEMVDHWMMRVASSKGDTSDPQVEPHFDLPPKAQEIVAAVVDATEVILWDQNRIWVALVKGLNPDDSPWELEDDPIQNFVNGFVKVALLGMDRSLLAWNTLLKYMPCRSDETLPLIAKLEELRRMTAILFPNARLFIRPGFDDGAAPMEQ